MTRQAEAVALEEHLTDEDIFAEAVAERTRTTPAPEEPEVELAPVEPPQVEEAPPPPASEGVGDEGAPPQPVENEAPEWYGSLSDEGKAAVDALNTDLTDVRSQYTALHGRLAPMQQANERLRQQAAHAGQRQPPGTPNSSAQRSQVSGEPTPALDLGDVPEFAEFREAFPEEAKAISALFGRQAEHANNLQQQLGSVSEGLQEIQQASFGKRREDDMARLGAAHSDWMQIRPSEHFNQWLQRQPAAVSRMASSESADECIYVLDRYKQDVWAMNQLAQGEEPEPPAGQSTRQIRERRKQLRSAPGLAPQGSNVGAPQGTSESLLSEEDVWAEEVRRRLKLQREMRN